MTENNNKTVEEMFALGAHLGYSKSKRHPSVKDYIYGNKDGTDIIDLEKTAEAVEKARNFLKEIFSNGEKVLFVGNKSEIKDLTSELASSENVLYVNNRWIGGTLTNFLEIKKRIKKLTELMDDAEKGEFEKYTKKERLDLNRSIEKLKKYYYGLLKMEKLPKALVLVDAKDESIAVKEALDSEIPTVAICNTDNDISKITYPIVANDRSRQSIEYIIKKLLNQ